MSVTPQLHDRVELIIGTTTPDDGLGNPTPDWTNPTIEEHPAWVGSLSSVTPTDLGSFFMIETMRCILPYGVEVDRLTTRVRWRGKLYTIDSDPMWRRKRGRDHHQTFTLKRVEGSGAA